MGGRRGFPSLAAFLADLEARGELARISVEVDPYLELPEIHRRVISRGGPALLFERVKGSPFAAVSNLFGSAARVERAAGCCTPQLVERLARLPERLLPPSLGRLWGERRTFRRLLRVGTRMRSRGSLLAGGERGGDISRLPLTTSWPGDGGPFLTTGLVCTRHPQQGSLNLGLYRMQAFDGRTLGMHWQIAKGGGFHHAAAEARGEALPVNVFLGGPPALLLAAVAPLPENLSELLLASLCIGSRLTLLANPKGPLPLVAEADFCLVGEVRPGERRPEGPFGDHYGAYSLRHEFPVFHVQALYHQREPVLPVTVVGKPRQEDFFIGNHLQKLLTPLFPLVMPGVKKLWSYGETGYHALAAAVVRERYRREAMATAFRILGEGQLGLTKFLLLLDEELDLTDFPAVLSHVLARADFRRDLFLFDHLAMDTLDYTGSALNEGGKGVLLGLGKVRRKLPTLFEGLLPSEVGEVVVFCPGCLVVDGPSWSRAPAFPRELARVEALSGWPLIVVVDEAPRACATSESFLWTTFTRFNPPRDMHGSEVRWEGGHAAFEAPLVIDARKKPGYPPEVAADPDTRELVDRRFSDYFPRGL